MIVKTKKYKLDPDVYVKISFANAMKQWWWAWLIPPAIFLIFLAFGLWGWGLGVAITLSGLYLLFWYVQFKGLTMHEKSKPLFDKYAYDINSKRIMMMIDAKRGSEITWDRVIKVEKREDAFVLYLSKFEFLYFPFNIFKSENEVKFVETVIRRKGYLSTPIKK